jgi:hypothetical protein
MKKKINTFLRKLYIFLGILKVVSVKNLKDVTAQQVFNFVAAHLLVQREKAGRVYPVSENSKGFKCLYLAPNGNTCAAGCLIPKELYNPEFEGKGWTGPAGELRVYSFHRDLINFLQDVHDGKDVNQWRKALYYLAKDKKLSWKITYMFL